MHLSLSVLRSCALFQIRLFALLADLELHLKYRPEPEKAKRNVYHVYPVHQ